ncbi:hypothetical protein HGRIS_006508 [Hohenbuehelia grisea]|uniref:DUF6532 domain-containing protein n=1 Tax=Hohenbuehelia grisea TaxID=104357 RepID=A0ABR3J946_9AGAR
MADFLFTTAYPSDDNNWKALRSLLRRCSRRLKFHEYAERFEEDVKFGADIAQVILNRLTTERKIVKEVAGTHVAGHYGLRPGESCVARVKHLIEGYKYIFAEDSEAFFASPRSSLAQKHAKHFSSVFEEAPRNHELELPIPLVALAATAVHCALQEWKDGAFVKLPFHGNTYQDVYEHHVRVLEDILIERSKYHRLMSDIAGKIIAGAVPVDVGAMEE